VPNVCGMVVTFVIATPGGRRRSQRLPPAPADFKTVSSRAFSEECSLHWSSTT
jgi:hypothetical protein